MIKNLLKVACGLVVGLTLSKSAGAISPDGSFVQTPADATASNLFTTFPPLGTTATAVVEASKGNYKAEIELAKPAARTFLEKGTLTPQLSRAFDLVREQNKRFCQDLAKADAKYLAQQIVTQRFSKPVKAPSPPVPGDAQADSKHE